jgi:VIT1/CCC1 family predicted Fe2+/Mn2+ transporter
MAMRGFTRASHREVHSGNRAAWLRAAVLGADDGIVSTASLMLGVAAAGASHTAVLTAGLAGLVAGAMSMAAGEYVSVSSQRDSERADLRIEKRELADDVEGERAELKRIYEDRGLSSELAATVAGQLMERDALAAHARDELGLDPQALARPLQAALVSAASFAAGASQPLLFEILAPAGLRVPAILAATLLALLLLGSLGAYLGGAPISKGAIRVLIGGSAAMAVTWLIGSLAGAAGL